MMDIDGMDDDEVAGFLTAIRNEERNLEEEEEIFYDALTNAFHDHWFDANEDEWEQEVDAQDRALQQNQIGVTEMADNIVGESCRRSYLEDNLNFIKWCQAEKPGWVTEYGSSALARLEAEAATLRSRGRSKLIQEGLKLLLHDAVFNPIVNLDQITPPGFMVYIDQCRNKRDKRRLSKSAYGNRRSALNDLFRWHDPTGGGFPEKFNWELTNLFKGFFRILAQDGGRRDNGDEEGRSVKEGKDPMSVMLYTKLCGWFLDAGTTDGIFAYCYLVLTWNLMCRVNNTSRICWNHLFTISNDALEIHFAHHKGDQMGDRAKYPRHVYANPNEPLVCPFLALALYLTTFNTTPPIDSRLFPGHQQFKRFSDIMKRVLKEHEAEVRECGQDIKDLGTHSIRKGASTFLSGVPGGPPAAAICVRAGWTMGRVRDIYIKYESGGDQFCGRALSMLPLLQPEFAASPPHFSPDCPRPWIETTIAATFPMLTGIDSQRRLLETCLAQLVYHKLHIEQWDENHFIRTSCQLFRDNQLTAAAIAHTRVLYPWSNDAHTYSFSGIPPHVALLFEIRIVAERQRKMVEELLVRIDETLDRRGIAGGTMSEQRMREIVRTATEDIRDGMNRLAIQGIGPGGDGLPGTTARTRVTPRGYTLHMYGGMIHLLPQHWRFPSVGILSLWQQWLLGDYTQNVPPLRIVKLHDVKHLDKIVLPAGITQRPARKILSDMKFLMEHVEMLVRENGTWENVHNQTTVTDMFRSVEGHFKIPSTGNGQHERRDAQMKWQTITHLLRKQKQQANN